MNRNLLSMAGRWLSVLALMVSMSGCSSGTQEIQLPVTGQEAALPALPPLSRATGTSLWAANSNPRSRPFQFPVRGQLASLFSSVA